MYKNGRYNMRMEHHGTDSSHTGRFQWGAFILAMTILPSTWLQWLKHAYFVQVVHTETVGQIIRIPVVMTDTLVGCVCSVCVCVYLQFRFATCRETLMMLGGSVCAFLHGSAKPLMLLVFGMLTDTFIEYDIELQELLNPRKERINNTIQWKNQSVWTDWLDSTKTDKMKNLTCG